jgi:transcriptional regulator with XRE-family HTH domain
MPCTAFILDGERLRNLRMARELTIEALVERSGVARTTIFRLEGGKKVPVMEHTLARLAKAYKIRLLDMVSLVTL